MEQLHHKGVLVPPRYKGRGLTINVRGQTTKLTDEQEERAMAWAKKIGTPYVEDPVFAVNFHEDFSEILGIKVQPGDVDYSAIYKEVMEERELRAGLSREERKALAAERKAVREANKEKYGWATVDGDLMEIGNYTVEPSSIFMGRGEHPMRGRWKEGPRHESVELNLSPDAPMPPGEWKAILWEPDTMWIARWRDKLSGKMKYVWPHDSSPLKQVKDIEKYDKALELVEVLPKIKRHIAESLYAVDSKRRQTAAVTFLIDHCKFRVGDEKDPDEADTIGASTLRPEHVKFNGDDTITFDFLGKDSIQHTICVEMPEHVINTLLEFSENAEPKYEKKLLEYQKMIKEQEEKLNEYMLLFEQNTNEENLRKKIDSCNNAIKRMQKRINKLRNTGPTLFDEVDSQLVSEFLDEVMTGLSAKVFRTHYASTTVEAELKRTKVDKGDPDYVKKHAATMANLEAARVCNHRRTIPKTWESSLQRKEDRLEARRTKAVENEGKLRQRAEDAERKHSERLGKYEQKLVEHSEKLEEYLGQLEERRSQGKSVISSEKRIESKRKAIKTQQERIEKLKVTHNQLMRRMKEQTARTRERDRQAIEKLELQISAQRETRDYNLGTSLKSYIDPRIYYDWSRRVDYDWKKYYPKTLQRKFSWVEADVD